MSQINALFRDGYWIENPLPLLLAKYYHAQVKADPYVDDGHGSCWIAGWESDLPSENENIPPHYLDLMNRLARECSIPQFFQMRFGPFSRTNVMLQKSRRGHDMDWHYDGNDPMHLVAMVYLTEEEWTEEEGGQLLIGEGDCNDLGLIDTTQSARQIAAISPAPGRVVWTLNTNPRQLHKVSTVNTDKERYVLIGQFGYQENVDKTSVRSQIKGWS